MGRRLSLGGVIRLASSFLRRKLHQARLDITGVTQAQLVVRKATRGRSHHGPDAATLKRISRAAFEIEDYWRIVGVLHKRLRRLKGNQWRKWYHALTVLEHLVIYGPDSASREFQPDSDAIRSQAAAFHYVDEAGFDWGLALRKRSERVLELLERGPLLREERERVRAPRREVQEFGGGGSAYRFTFPSGADGCGSTSLCDPNKENNCSSREGFSGAPAPHDPWRCGHPTAAASKTLERGREMVLWRNGGGNEAVTIGATFAAAAVVPVAEESMPLRAGDSLLESWF